MTDVMLTMQRHRRRFPDIEHELCAACGERIFGIGASRRFDATRAAASSTTAT